MPSGDAVRTIVVMGVSGSGKSTIGVELAKRLGWPFVDGDALHSAISVAKMAAGVPLTDADRAPWLAAVGAQIDAWQRAGEHGVIACSALRRSYRDALLSGRSGVVFVHLTAAREVLLARVGARLGHFMPASLLDDQLATLEPPAPDEPAVTVGAFSPAGAVTKILARMGLVPEVNPPP